MFSPKQRQFVAFVIAGGMAAVVNFFSRIVLANWLDYTSSIVVAYIIGMATAFALNRLFVFQDAANAVHHQIFWFTVVNLAAVIQTLLISLLLVKVFFPRVGMTYHPEMLAHAAGVIFPIGTSFIGHKRFSFRPTKSG
jgi:putative flippase GtrA